MCEQELVKSRLRVNAANVSVRIVWVTVCVWLSSSWDLILSADKLADHEQQAAGNRVQGGSDVVIPISTTPETLIMGRGAVVNSSKAQASGVIFACTKHTGSWPAASLWYVRLVCLYSAKAVPLSHSVQISLRQQPTQEKAGLKAVILDV